MVERRVAARMAVLLHCAKVTVKAGVVLRSFDRLVSVEEHHR
jgi:hypothetical protein